MLYSTISGVTRYSQGTVVLSRGQSIDPDHPLAKEKPELFTDEDPGASIKTAPRRVETGMQRPGEVRSESQPVIPAARPPAAKATPAAKKTQPKAANK